MLKFTALPVSEGDAFLLHSDDKIILVDTGIKNNQCFEFLEKKGIKKLDLVVITHYDKDHIGGLQEILKSIEISEIWLPEVFGKIHESAKEPGVTLLKKRIEYERKKVEMEDSNEEVEDVFGVCILLTGHNLNLEGNYDNNLISFKTENNQEVLGYIKRRHIYKIMEIVDDLVSTTTNIIWLKYVERNLPIKINPTLPLFGLNCVQTKIIRPYTNDLELLLYLTQINRESLVFKYCKEKEPNILYSSDSDYDFLSVGEKISLNDDSIVTTPHHGSTSNDRAYCLVDGKDLIYVRSYSQKVTLSTCYIYLKRKYCVKCKHKNGREGEVKLEYTKKYGWNDNCNFCTCRYSEKDPNV